VLLPACELVQGLQHATLDTTSGSGGSGGSGGETTSMSSGGSGGSMKCEPGASQTCYSGPEKTKEVGLCKSGKQLCAADGSGFGVCDGEVLPAVELCADPADEDCNGADCFVWAKVLKAPGDQELQGFGVDSKGNVYIAGQFSGTIDLGGGPLISAGGKDIFVAKFDADGQHVWSQHFGTAAGSEYVDAFAVSGAGRLAFAANGGTPIDFGGGPVPADPTHEAIALFDANGKALWSGAVGAESAVGVRSMAFDVAQNLLVAGTFIGTGDFGKGAISSNGGQDAFLFEKSGLDFATIWSVGLGGNDTDFATSVSVDPAGNIMLAGRFMGDRLSL
jgi:hypothetical protein